MRFCPLSTVEGVSEWTESWKHSDRLELPNRFVVRIRHYATDVHCGRIVSLLRVWWEFDPEMDQGSETPGFVGQCFSNIRTTTKKDSLSKMSLLQPVRELFQDSIKFGSRTETLIQCKTHSRSIRYIKFARRQIPGNLSTRGWWWEIV